jgi:glycosyltransferase involved in cell wall biosynthesis
MHGALPQAGEVTGLVEACPGVSVVVAVRGNWTALDGLAAALCAQDIPGGVDLIVADNHSTPVLPPGSGRLGPMACRIVHEPRAGLSRARNAGIRSARGDIVLVTDPDARPEPDWARLMVQALRETGAYCAGGKVVPRFPDGAPTSLSAELLQLFVPPSWPAATEELAGPYWLVGCNLAVRRSPLPQFDTRLGVTGSRHLSCEELEFTVRAQRDGLCVVVVPDAVVHRTIRSADLMAGAFFGRALWHGVSIARLLSIHPGADIYDTYRLRDALVLSRLTSHMGRRIMAGDLLRITGLRSEQLRLALDRFRNKSTSTRESAMSKEVGHG